MFKRNSIIIKLMRFTQELMLNLVEKKRNKKLQIDMQRCD